MQIISSFVTPYPGALRMGTTGATNGVVGHCLLCDRFSPNRRFVDLVRPRGYRSSASEGDEEAESDESVGEELHYGGLN